MDNEDYQPGTKYPIVKAAFDLEVNRLNYQKLLQDLSGIQITRDNVNEDVTKNAREVLKALVDKKDEDSKEPLQWHKDIMAAYKSLFAPLKAEIDRIAVEKKSVSAQIDKEKEKQLFEQNRIVSAKTAIISFVNKVANMIAAAITDDDVVSIEKMIGAEKTKKNLYQEFIPDLIIQCDGLRPQIKKQKENIRELQRITEKEKHAEDSGDILELTDLKGQKEHLQLVIQETGIRIHETAFERATLVDVIAPDVAETTPKGRTNWKWRVDDIKMLQKKMPHLVKLVPDEEAIAILLKTKKTDGSFEGKSEENLFGLVFFNDKTYR